MVEKTEHLALVVDDNFYNRDLCRMALDHVGYSVIEADNGKNALRLLADQPIDLLVLDLAMPQVDGLTVLREIQSNGLYPHLPVIVITANPHMSGDLAALGIDYVLYKPIDITAFAQLAERIRFRMTH